ncbi:ABC transporter substrate-binding protein [Mycolicibacterium sp. 018/SC-01/001]|uniref:ABC transporter substrate-binding protein n=1 Tax=Mycolicibacterium sp. 018/SC-01/001 TaxID=2592069 RepID=UPI00117F64A0|nr:ABC transporter substrate-binding protein [Mycolicibacterium sp. 018/SC-01/001]TRW76969.1 ABC transporter substrate-binding protein [Mycolicibacterium sp. 018/SC-01/001]
MTKRISGVLAAFAACVLALAGCSSGTPNSTGGGGTGAPTDGVLTVGLLGDIGQPPDPDIYYANNGTAIMINAYEGLVQYKNNTPQVEIAPRLAESWDVNPAHDVYTFHLRKGVKFHDGTPFTSAAVDVAFKRRIAVKGGAAYMVEGVKSVATPDDYTAVVTLTEPNTAFLSYLASPFGPKMESPEGLKANAGSDDAQTYLSSHDLGTGPYRLTTAQTGVKYELTRFDDYWGPKSPFTKVELPVYTDESALELAFDNGTVDTIVAALPSSSLDKYTTKDGVSNYFLPTLQGALVTVNPSHEFFKTPPARVAFLKSIDQASLVKQVLGKRSEVATTMYAKGMIPTNIPGVVDKQAISHDAGALKGYVDSLPAGATKTLVIGYANGNVNAQAMTNIVVANLQSAGLQATAQGYDTSTVFGWINDPATGPDAFIDGNNGPDGGDPYMWGHVFWDASGGINYFGCESKEVNQLLEEAKRTGDMATYTRAGDLYGQTGCFLNLSYNQDWVVAQKWLTGVPESQNIGANELNFSLLGIAG